MSVSGTGVAAGVAQVGLQAQQLSRQQARQTQDRTYIQQRQKEIRETRRKGLVEDDGAQAETALHVDGDLPDQERHPDARSPQQHPHAEDEAADASAEASHDASVDEPGAEAPPMVYGPPRHLPAAAPPVARHRLDVQA